MVTPSTAPYKPSPLSFGSPRTSPFRRPESPTASSPTTTIRPPTTPTSSPPKAHTPLTSPSKLYRSHTADDNAFVQSGALRSREPEVSPRRESGISNAMANMMGVKSGIDGDTLSKIPPAQLREMREAFQVLDRDSDGQIIREDVVDILMNLGQDSTSSATAQYFPPGAPQTLNLPVFLNSLASLLAPLSSQNELLNAFAAFDDDDSGQVDLNELRDALLHTAPEPGEHPLTEREIEIVVQGFIGRRAFGRGMGASAMGQRRGEVFRYQEFVGSVTGGVTGSAAQGGAGGSRDGETMKA